jgi:hypothetical protein
MAALMPKAQLVPAVDPDNLHPDKAVVSTATRAGYCSLPNVATLQLACVLVGGSKGGLQCLGWRKWSSNPLVLLSVSVGPQVQSFKDDPLVFKGNLRAQTGNELLKVGPA